MNKLTLYKTNVSNGHKKSILNCHTEFIFLVCTHDEGSSKRTVLGSCDRNIQLDGLQP